MLSGKRVLMGGLFLAGLVGFLAFRVEWTQQKEKSFTAQPISYSIDPPSENINGEIKQAFGDVKKFSRTGIEFEKTKNGEKVLLGESIATGADGRLMVEFKDFGQVGFAPQSEATFVELIPTLFSVRQINGTVFYEGKEDNTISVRSMHMLLSLNGSGSVHVDKDRGQINIEVLSGTGTIGMMDNNNRTNKWDVKKGQRIFIDDESRTVRVGG